MTNPSITKKKETWEERFDKLWPNLYTVVPGLGQGDAIRAVKRFIRQQRSQTLSDLGIDKKLNEGDLFIFIKGKLQPFPLWNIGKVANLYSNHISDLREKIEARKYKNAEPLTNNDSFNHGLEFVLALIKEEE